MTELHIDIIEAVWIAVNLSAFVLTIAALVDARSLVKSAKVDGGARLIQARGNLRRETVRLVTQVALLSLVLPGLTTDYPTPLNPFGLALIAIPFLVFLNTASDAWDRRQLAGIVWAQIESERGAAFSRLELAIAENTRISREGVAKATAAYDVGNHVAEKFDEIQRAASLQGDAILAQGEEQANDRRERMADRAEDRTAARAHAVTVDETAEQVTDIHQQIVPEPGS